MSLSFAPEVATGHSVQKTFLVHLSSTVYASCRKHYIRKKKTVLRTSCGQTCVQFST